jgi:hypothetical protein
MFKLERTSHLFHHLIAKTYTLAGTLPPNVSSLMESPLFDTFSNHKTDNLAEDLAREQDGRPCAIIPRAQQS